jgi:hypothetical protein
MMRLYYLGSVVFSILLISFFISTPALAERTFLDTLKMIFGMQEETGPKPEDTLVAPFAEGHIKPLDKGFHKDARLPVNKIPMDMPHRPQDEIAEWLSNAAGDALILDRDKISNIKTILAPYFSEEAFAQYKRFGEKSHIFSAVFHGEQTTLTSFISDSPVLNYARVVDGAFEWQYEIPVTLNLVKGDLKEYKKTKATQQQKNVTLCLTARRTEDAGNSGILIHDWRTGQCPDE